MDDASEELAMHVLDGRPLCYEAKEPRRRTNCECIVELADELWKLDRSYIRLGLAINANPQYVPDSQKAIWPVQYKAMGEYKTALKKRIIDLINTDN